MGVVHRINWLDDGHGIFGGAAHFFHITRADVIDSYIALVFSGAEETIIVHSRNYLMDIVGKRLPKIEVLGDTFEWEL